VLVGSSTTLPGGRAFKVTLELQASPCGTRVALMGGGWSVTSVRETHLFAPFYTKNDRCTKTGSGQTQENSKRDMDFSQVHCLNDLRGFCVEQVEGWYRGVPLAPSVTPACGAQWTRLEAVVRSPPANVTANGTALQLRLTPLPTERGHGAQVWIGAASIVAASAAVVGV
jgi:hypothetical protein